MEKNTEKNEKLDKTIKKLEGVSDKVNIIMRNRLIIAIFLIVDGITFMLNPNGSLAEMARSIIILVLLASFSTFLANLSAKPRDTKSIITSLLILVIGIVLYIYPDLVSAYIQLILSIFIIVNSLKNILNTSSMDKLTGYYTNITKKYTKKKKPEKESLKEVNKNINEGLEQQKEKLITPLTNIVNKADKTSKLYVATNVATIILGITLIIFPDVSMVIWGLIFLYTGLSDFIVSLKTMNVTAKIKEKVFKK